MNRTRNGRQGFTLVELIVVMTILAILSSLLVGAVNRARHTADEARATIEIRQLAAAVENFKQKYGVNYIPSQLVLKNNFKWYNLNDPLEAASKKYLMALFPRLDPKFVTGNQSINWTGKFGDPKDAIELNGSESLIFFLGGRCIESNGQIRCLGFSSNGANPWPDVAETSNASFEFDTTRLLPSPFQRQPQTDPANPTVKSAICVYLDTFASGTDDMPYAYFSSNSSGDDYGKFNLPSGTSAAHPDVIEYTTSKVVNPPAIWSNVSNYPFRLAPFMDAQNLNKAANKFYNPKGFQLISAGRNKRFGNFQSLSTPPTNRVGFIIWENGSYDSTTKPTPPSDREDELGDNLCNFHPVKMGMPQ